MQLHTDMDRNDGRTKYVLRGEGAGSVFVIDEKTGNIHVTKPLDREEKDEYRLIATATDRLTDRALEPSSQFIIRVQDINDNPPVFDDGPYSATVSEMANIGTGGQWEGASNLLMRKKEDILAHKILIKTNTISDLYYH